MMMMMAMMAMMMMMKCQFHWWRKPENLEETSDLRQVTDKLSHMHVYGLCPIPGSNSGRSGVKPVTPGHGSNALYIAHRATEAPRRRQVDIRGEKGKTPGSQLRCLPFSFSVYVCVCVGGDRRLGSPATKVEVVLLLDAFGCHGRII